MTLASGLELSDPIPVDIAAGSKPMVAINAVINKGLARELMPRLMDTYNGLSDPLAFSRLALKADTSNTPSRMQIPKRAIKPIPADILKFVPVINKAHIPPTTAKGTFKKIRPASLKLPNMI